LRSWDECGDGSDAVETTKYGNTSIMASPARALQDCNTLLSAERIAEFDKMIADFPLVLFAIHNARCTYAAQRRFRDLELCFQEFHLDDSTWAYFQCKHPNEIVNNAIMHSYVYMGGEFLGNGFKLLDPAVYQAPFQLYTTETLRQKAQAAGVKTCVEKCESYLGTGEREELERAIATTPVVLYGWNGCPCTNIARKRFMAKGLCFLENVWSDPQDRRQQFLNCKYGKEHHSFVWIGGKFLGNGFDMADDKLDQATFESKVNAAGGVYACQQAGDRNLWNEPLKSCTQANDGTTTGWTRSGSCVWEPSDGGYHQVCVTMSQKFLEQSAKHDANDLSSVVNEGGHWCICAWAWASAVQRDPEGKEGIVLDCERTNGRLRNVYGMFIDEDKLIHSPSGAGYRAYEALQAVNEVCGEAGNPASGTMQRPPEAPATEAPAPATEAPTEAPVPATEAPTEPPAPIPAPAPAPAKEEVTAPEEKPAATPEEKPAVPAPEMKSESAPPQVEVSFKIENLKLAKLDETQKESIKASAKTTIAKAAGVMEKDVEILLSAGSVKVTAVIKSEKIENLEPAAAKKLETEMEGSRGKAVAEAVLEEVKKIPDIEKAVEVSGMELSVTAPTVDVPKMAGKTEEKEEEKKEEEKKEEEKKEEAPAGPPENQESASEAHRAWSGILVPVLASLFLGVVAALPVPQL